ncbi:hypothetical protein [Cupriavidus sp. BIC8F]|uniref:hypothetical protein n=1 Tax=Cupriavidus sp. BIC8F TaxID=3079014 RepID=UPI002916A6DF|nr:hypothetical protein [Cupriavidus sp. BIC8F]
MSEQTHVSPKGVKYRLVSTKETTQTNDSAAKEIKTDSTTVEVVVSDSRLISSGSQWGHVAIIVDGVIYSRAHEEYVKTDERTYFFGGTLQLTNGTLTTHGNQWRDSAGLVLRLSPAEKAIIKRELERRIKVDQEFKRKHPGSTTYSLFDNSCSSNVADVLELVGIMAHDPRWLPTPVTPAELEKALEKSKRLVRKNYYPKRG